MHFNILINIGKINRTEWSDHAEGWWWYPLIRPSVHILLCLYRRYEKHFMKLNASCLKISLWQLSLYLKGWQGVKTCDQWNPIVLARKSFRLISDTIYCIWISSFSSKTNIKNDMQFFYHENELAFSK